MHRTLLGLVCALTLLLPSHVARADDAVPLDFSQAQWIWAAGDAPLGDMVGFRRTVEVAGKPVFGRLWITADAAYELTVNGSVLGEADGWADPEQYDLASVLKQGANQLTIKTVGGRHPGLLVSGRIVDADGRLIDLVSDAQWKASRQLPAGWEGAEFDASGWAAAASLGQYGSPPWGRLTGMNVGEAQKAYDALAFDVPDESGAHPASAFMGQYAVPALADRYLDYLTVDRVTGRFASDSGDSSRLFVRYRQSGGVTSPAQFDFQQYESDLKLLAELGFDIALSGFGWADLLDADGRWAKVGLQPAGLDNVEYAYQAVDVALDMAEAHGLHVLALMDLSQPLAVLPAEHRDKVLVADTLWDGLLRGVAKVAKRYANRPVLAGWVVGPDALPAFPRSDEPMVRQLWEEQLRSNYGSIGALREAWSATGLASFADVPLPNGPDAPGASDLGALDGRLVGSRMASLADALRAADPHHLLVAAAGDPARPLPISGALAYHVVAAATVLGNTITGPDGIPAYGEALACVRALQAVPGSDLAGTMGGHFGGGLRGAYAARALRQEWADVVGSGGAGLLTEVGLDQLTGGAIPGVEQRAGLQSLSKLVAASQGDYAAPDSSVLVVRSGMSDAENLALRRVLATLGSEGVAPAVAAAAVLARGGAPDRIDLDAYQAVIVPHVEASSGSAWIGLLNEWVSAKSGRLLLLGLAGEPGQPPSKAISDLTGGISPVTAPTAQQTLTIGAPLTALPIGRKVNLPDGLRFNALSVPAAEGCTVAGKVGGAAVVAVRETDGSQVVVTGFALDLCGLPDSSSDAGAQLLATTVGAAVDQAGLGAAWTSPANVAAYPGRTVALVREVAGGSSEIAWRGQADAPPVAWRDAATRYAADGTVEVDVALGPYQVVALPVAGEVVGLNSGDAAVIRASGGSDGKLLAFSGVGPSGLALRMAADPDVPVSLIRQGGGISTMPAGSTEVTVPLDSGMVQVAYGARGPAGSGQVSDPEAFMVVGDYYISKGDFGRAMSEFERLGQLYPGTAVAATADARRQKLLAESGAVVMVNYSRQPVQVRYTGPSTLDAAVPAGQSRTVILHAGDYQEIQKVSGAVDWSPAPLTDSRSFAVAKGEALVREWGVPAGGGGLNPKLNVRGKLTDSEKETLLAQAKSQLPAPPPEGGAAAGPAGGTQDDKGQLTGPELPIVVDVETETLQEQKNPPEISIRNKTKEAIELSMVFFSVGVRPRTEVFQLKARGRLRIELKDTGTYQIEGVVLSNNQLLSFGQFEPDVYVENNVTIRELSARELKDQADAEARRGVATSR